MGARKGALEGEARKVTSNLQLVLSASCEFLKNGIKKDLRKSLETIPPYITEFPVEL